MEVIPDFINYFSFSNLQNLLIKSLKILLTYIGPFMILLYPVNNNNKNGLEKNKNDFFCTEEKQQKWFFFQSSNKMIIFLNDLNLPLMRIHSNLDPGKNIRSWKRTPNGRIMGSHDHELCSYIWNTVGAHQIWSMALNFHHWAATLWPTFNSSADSWPFLI